MLTAGSIKLIFVLTLSCSKIGVGANYHGYWNSPAWNYHDTNWGVHYSTCNGKRQSPIALTRQISLFSPVGPISFGFYDIELQPDLVVFNNGRTVEMLVPDTTLGRRPFITGGIMQSTFEAQNVHFHWGSPDNKGSEHTIDGNPFDVEMHIVHKNVIYSTMEEAVKHSDGLAVLGVMLKSVNYGESICSGLSQILDLLPNIVEYGSEAPVNGPLQLGKLLHNLSMKNFFTYSGSLTTPPCSEAVIWNVFDSAIPVPYSQIQRFWNIKDEYGDNLVNNYRPIQDRNLRQVCYRAFSFECVPF